MAMIKRSQWGALGGRGDLEFRKRELFFHHSVFGGAAIDTGREQKAAMRQFDRQHLNQGWSGIGYNLVIFQPYGRLRRARIFEGRGWDYVPAAQAGHNAGTIACCIVGNFQHQRLKRSTKVAMRAIARGAKRRGVTRLGGHRDVQATACPGTHIYDYLPTLRRKLGLGRIG